MKIAFIGNGHNPSSVNIREHPDFDESLMGAGYWLSSSFCGLAYNQVPLDTAMRFSRNLIPHRETIGNSAVMIDLEPFPRDWEPGTMTNGLRWDAIAQTADWEKLNWFPWRGDLVSQTYYGQGGGKKNPPLMRAYMKGDMLARNDIPEMQKWARSMKRKAHRFQGIPTLGLVTAGNLKLLMTENAISTVINEWIDTFAIWAGVQDQSDINDLPVAELMQSVRALNERLPR